MVFCPVFRPQFRVGGKELTLFEASSSHGTVFFIIGSIFQGRVQRCGNRQKCSILKTYSERSPGCWDEDVCFAGLEGPWQFPAIRLCVQVSHPGSHHAGSGVIVLNTVGCWRRAGTRVRTGHSNVSSGCGLLGGSWEARWPHQRSDCPQMLSVRGSARVDQRNQVYAGPCESGTFRIFSDAGLMSLKGPSDAWQVWVPTLPYH